MSLFPTRTVSSLLLATVALVAALGLGACSRDQHLTDSLAGPGRESTDSFKHGVAPPPVILPPPVVTPPPPGAVGSPCTSLTGMGGAVAPVTAGIVQFRAVRTRIEVSGDVASGAINLLGPCSSLLAPAVTFVSGSATLSKGTVRALTFGAALSGAPIGEPGVVVATDAVGNVLEIVWPALAGVGVGAPILRLQLVGTNGLKTGDLVTATMTFVARTANGTTATFTALGSNMAVPALQ